MKVEFVFAGFGGQGILLMGRVIAQAAMEEGRYVTFLPSYGPEMRGGTANACVVVSDQPVASPIIDHSDVLVAMNQPSYEKFGPLVRGGGLIIYDSSLVQARERAQVRQVGGAFTEIAGQLGNTLVCSMVAIGRVIRETGIARLETVRLQVQALTAKRPELTALNLEAVERGYNEQEVQR
ncbi:MAG: 2-oxoacid:acceptor oxidoreductase family protein [bacterium]|nr:2-oxoacid:acceptor oxidoreductase family protein [bacterium]